MPTINIYLNNGVQGVVLNKDNAFNAYESAAECIAQYKDTLSEYEARPGNTWAMSTSLFKMEMEANVFVLEFGGDGMDFIAMMNQREHKVQRAGNQACPISIAEMTVEELEPYLPQLLSIATGKPMTQGE